ncbi:hypothetical protein F3Y22_tig00005411pilonHSYRG00043 [Hibiscus syriacus]|uniref:Uncharacterized protein n=1 Tax=Hibiscus syriacus TaxID=106335 RepID=A0A6A3CE84_HIBSY|nr:hypothetical protein F3Y22_tig00005411pilonHSYRG00043 [Hibiscus syriacus]
MYLKSRGNPPSPPGPRGLPIVGSLPFLRPDLHSYFADLARTYGPVVKLQLGSKLGILVTSPSAAREVLKDQDIAWNPYGPEWRMLRKVCVIKMLSNATLDKAYELCRREVRQTVGYLYSKARSPVNVGEQMFLTILNVVTNMLWGGTVEGEARASLGSEFRQVISETTELLGSDTSSNSIEFMLAEIINKPEVMRKAQQELDEVIGKDNLVEESHIHKLPYLLAIMKESLRLHPALPLLIPHCPVNPAPSVVMLSEGSRVFVNAWAIHRDPRSGKIHRSSTLTEDGVVSVGTLLHSFDWKVPEGNNIDLTEKLGSS